MLLGTTPRTIRQIAIPGLPVTGLQNLRAQIEILRYRIDKIALDHLPGTATVTQSLKEPGLRSKQAAVTATRWMPLDFQQQAPNCLGIWEFPDHRSMTIKQGLARCIQPRTWSGKQPSANTTSNNH
jgi:hypothetical protein